MKELTKQIEDGGMEVAFSNSYNVWIKAVNHTVMIRKSSIMGLEQSDLMLRIKQKFYFHNIKIDLIDVRNNKSKEIYHRTNDSKKKRKKKKKIETSDELSVYEKKRKIRELLTTKYKLL